MSENCDQNCSSCGEGGCEDRKVESLLEQPHALSHVKKVIGVISGKGGVGKSLVTSMSSVLAQRNGYNTAILDADITGPSIPKMFGIHEKASGDDGGIFPISSKLGTKVMSINLLLENETDPVVWRGPMIGGTVKQFWTDVIWGDVDYMFVDMPPGTGDVALTVFQSLPVDGIIIVTSPQELVSMIVEKAVKMANMMDIPVLGIVENMSYVTCPDCGKEIKVFGESHIEQIAKEYNLDILGRVPLDTRLASACDKGMIELFEGQWLDPLVAKLDHLAGNASAPDVTQTTNNMEEKNMKIAVACLDQKVAEHFGHCESFNFYEIENGKIISEEIVANPGHKPGFLPNFLADRGAKVIVAGGMGGGAVDIFNERGVEVVLGATGTGKEAAQLFAEGKLQSTGSICDDHKMEEHHQ